MVPNMACKEAATDHAQVLLNDHPSQERLQTPRDPENNIHILPRTDSGCRS